MPLNLPFSQKLLNKLATSGATEYELESSANEDLELFLELLYSQGLELKQQDGRYFFSTNFIPLDSAEFCIVDIETNGSKLEKHQIIEIAALKVQNNKVVDRFETFVECDCINEHITRITGISTEQTKNAPKIDTVLREFRKFLGSAVFVAHDVKFDYMFISGSMEKLGLGILQNQTLCSIDLAERTLSSYRYGLEYLNACFNLYPEAKHHRAMSDVITTYKLLERSLQTLNDFENPPKTVGELLLFAKQSNRLKRPKFDPLGV